MYQNGVEITRLDQVHMKGILLWATEDLAAELWAKFKIEK